MPSWSPSEPQDGQQEAASPTAPAGEDEVAAARRLLADLFEDAPAADGEGEQADR